MEVVLLRETGKRTIPTLNAGQMFILINGHVFQTFVRAFRGFRFEPYSGRSADSVLNN